MNILKIKYYTKTDEDLFELIQEKEQKAFDLLYERYSKKLFYYFYKMLNGDKDKAEDFVQDIFYKLIQNPFAYDKTKKFSTWIYAVAYNMCKNEYKRLNIRNHEILDEDNDDFLSSFDIETNYDLNNFSIELNFILSKMSEDHRNTFILRYANDLSIKEISEVMECKEGTVKSRLFYCLRILSKKLQVYNQAR